MTDDPRPAHPYADLPDRAFWRRGVVDDGGAGLADLHRPKWPLAPGTAVATAGSCFAQHIGRWLARAGLRVLDAEPAPPLMPDAVAHRFGYRLFSGRYGNIYTARQMRQLLEEIAGGAVRPGIAWPAAGGRYVDALRPTVEPDGLDTADEVVLHRDYHLEKTAQMLRGTDLFIFTLGLTEAWEDAATGTVFPVCPGVAAGRFDPDRHRLRRFRYGEVTEDLHAILRLLRRFNPDMRLLLTVSPVPLTATAGPDHVLTATTGAKAALRAAAGDLAADEAAVDYFPSFELVTSHATGGPWFTDNLRTVSAEGVEMVMGRFLAAHGLSATDAASAAAPDAGPAGALTDAAPGDDEVDGLVCDEMLLQGAAR